MTAIAVSARPASRLGKVKRGQLRQPLRYVIYGAEGVGKTTLCADAPDPIWIDAEDGSANLNVSRYEFHDGPSPHVPRNYDDVLAAIDDLTASEHGYKTLVLDTADRLESMIWRMMIERDSTPSAQNQKSRTLGSIEDYGYGKGYVMAVEEWRALCARLDRLRSVRQMAIVVIAHAQVRPFKNPTGEDFDRYQLRINEKAGGFLKEWADVTGFACFEDGASKAIGSKSERPRGFSTGRRLLKLSRTAAFDAKTRIALPEEVEITIDNPWGPLAHAIDSGYEKVEDLIRDIDAEVVRIGDPAMKTKVDLAVKDAIAKGDEAALARYLAALKAKPVAGQENDK